MHFKFSYVLALAMTGAVATWMATGTIVRGGQEDSANGTPPPAERQQDSQGTLFKVEVLPVSAQARLSLLEIRGRTEAHAKVAVRAETAAVVNERPARSGARVEAGDVLCRMDVGTREANVAEAKAMLAQAQLNYKAADKLSQSGFTAQTTLAAQQAALDAARARVEEAELELNRTQVRAPISGVIESPMADVGARLNVGDTCATIVAFNPMTAIGQVAELNVGKLALGMTATVDLITGQSVPGKVTYIAPAADADTRTFRIEVEMDNADGSIRDGLTALTRIELPTRQAHFLSPSMLTLNDAGQIGVRAVNDQNITEFHPVTILGNEGQGVWVDGLPETVTIITVGQDYVKDGETVEPIVKTAEAAR